MSLRTGGFVLAGVLSLTGCAHTSGGLSPDTRGRLESTPGGFLSGAVEGFDGEPTVLNRKDFIYALDFAPKGQRVAYTRLGDKAYHVSIWDLAPAAAKPGEASAPVMRADPSVNAQQYDLEGVAFSPDGARVATVSRSGAVQLFDAATGSQVGALATEEPLVSVAFHPDGRWLAVGSAQGLVSLLSVPELSFGAEARLHAGPVSALAFAADGTLYSGGWDGHVRASDTPEQTLKPDVARTHFERRGGFAAVQGRVDSGPPVVLALDSRTPVVVLTTAAATASGIDVAFLKDTVTVPGALGNTVARLSRGRTLRFKQLTLPGVDVAVCDACVPQGSQGVLGAPFAERVDTVFDETTAEAVLTLKGGVPEGAATATARALTPKRDFTFPAHVNDVTVDARGQRLGVAFSQEKAERNRTVYERERKGLQEPQGPWNAGALVDAASGQVLRKWELHHGVVSTAAIAPDGRSLASGGWDRRVYLFAEGAPEAKGELEFGWSVRRVRFSPEGHQLGVAAWTPQKATGSQESDPAAVVVDVRYASPTVEPRAAQ
ncbi:MULTISPECIES: WD40 repeat domain-containing protein [unclassified Corallococcus]|uniref:WD40 repeat domain-containing protein n=1 Tax=unclassified Corallococcus TaxID=2685029 RepID=UPI001A8CC690|nr:MULTISPECIES: aspartyl protease family protein [unclassified Corallococcus]MBN9688566.1 aspartyl protease family protein [Corallococcus sp. NCSPR001]WAS87631.1 aspartyl protease family protein [Corallococcus sp. NCRR]